MDNPIVTIALVSLNRHKIPYPVYPLGISYLKGFLKKHLCNRNSTWYRDNGLKAEYRVEILDCNILGNEMLKEKILELSPSYICFSMRNIDDTNALSYKNFINEYKEITDEIKPLIKTRVILGGSAYSIYPKEIFRAIEPDYGVIGEGELSLLNLVTKLEKGEDPSNVEGLVYRDGEGEIKCKSNHTEYIGNFELEYEEQSLDYYWQNGGVLNIQTKRGCPYNCIYCTYPIIDGRKIRTFRVEDIVTKIEELKKKCGIDYIFFTDSVFNINNSYNMRLAEEMIRRKLNIRWGAYFSPSNITAEMMELFAKSGLTHIEFGTESLCDRQLKNYGKNFSVDEVVRVSELALKNNIYYAHFLILGGYGENWSTIAETMENSKRIRYSLFFPHFGMRIYKGTRLHEIALEKGIVAPDDELVEPAYYIEEGIDMEKIRRAAAESGKAWIFPDDPDYAIIDNFRKKRNKKGLLWEYLRRP